MTKEQIIRNYITSNLENCHYMRDFRGLNVVREKLDPHVLFRKEEKMWIMTHSFRKEIIKFVPTSGKYINQWVRKNQKVITKSINISMLERIITVINSVGEFISERISKFIEKQLF